MRTIIRGAVLLPSRPNAEQRAQAAEDARQSGAAYDRTWPAGERNGHVKARTAGRTEVSGGSNARVKNLAETGGPVIEHHVNGIVAARRG